MANTLRNPPGRPYIDYAEGDGTLHIATSFGGTGTDYVIIEWQRQTNNGAWVTVANSDANWGDGSLVEGAKSMPSQSVVRYRARWKNTTTNQNSSWSPVLGDIQTPPGKPTRFALRWLSESTAEAVVSLDAYPASYSRRVVVYYDTGGGWSQVGARDGVGKTFAADEVFTVPAEASGFGTYYVEICKRLYEGHIQYGEPIDYKTEAVDATLPRLSAPLAPTLTGPSPLIPSGHDVVVTWTHNSTDTSPQTAAQVEFDGDGPIEIEGGDHLLSRPGLQIGSHTVRVRTKGLHGEWGPWSESRAFDVVAPPVVTIESPPTGEPQTYGEYPIHVRVSATDETGIVTLSAYVADAVTTERIWEGSVAGDGGGALLDESLEGDRLPLENGGRYVVGAEASNGRGLTATQGELARFSIEWYSPAPPLVDIRYDLDLLRAYLDPSYGDRVRAEAHVTGSSDVDAGRVDHEGRLSRTGETYETRDESFLPTESFDVWRIDPDGTETLIASGVPSGHEVEDEFPPLNVDYAYRVVAKSAIGTTAETVVQARLDSEGRAGISFGDDLSELAVLMYDVAYGDDGGPTGDSYYFVGDVGRSGLEEKVYYPTPQLAETYSITGVVLSNEDADTFRRCRRYPGRCYYRSWHGEARFVRILSLSVSIDADSWRKWDVSISMEPLHA